MDKTTYEREVSEELTRESLIEISYFDPEKVLSSQKSLDNLTYDKLINGVSYDDGQDKYRSELISISSQQPPETLPTPEVKS